MRRKRPLVPEVLPETPVIPLALIEEAKRAIELDRMKALAKCNQKIPVLPPEDITREVIYGDHD